MADLTEVKRGENFIIYKDRNDNPVIRIDKVRLSYAFLGNQREEENEAGEKTYAWSVNAMLPKETHTAAKNAVKEVIKQICDKNKFQVPQEKWFLSDGDGKVIEKTGKADEIAAGHWLVAMRDQKTAPVCRNGMKEKVTDRDEIDKMFYSGAWGHVLVRPWFFDGKAKGKTKTYPKRVSAGIAGVLFWKDDKRFGAGQIDDSDAWDDAPESEGANNGIDADDGGGSGDEL